MGQDIGNTCWPVMFSAVPSGLKRAGAVTQRRDAGLFSGVPPPGQRMAAAGVRFGNRLVRGRKAVEAALVLAGAGKKGDSLGGGHGRW